MSALRYLLNHGVNQRQIRRKPYDPWKSKPHALWDGLNGLPGRGGVALGEENGKFPWWLPLCFFSGGGLIPPSRQGERRCPEKGPGRERDVRGSLSQRLAGGTPVGRWAAGFRGLFQ